MKINRSNVGGALRRIIEENFNGSGVFFAKLCDLKKSEQIPALLIAMNALANKVEKLIEIVEEQASEISVLEDKNNSLGQSIENLETRNDKSEQTIKYLDEQYNCLIKRLQENLVIT